MDILTVLCQCGSCYSSTMEAADSNDSRMEFLFRHRGAGKRQVKPSQDIALLEDQIGKGFFYFIIFGLLLYLEA